MYGIAATSTKFSNGGEYRSLYPCTSLLRVYHRAHSSTTVRFTADTDIIPIGLGQSYTQPADFTNGFSRPDNNAPNTGFSFINKADGAAAVVYKKVLGKWAPIYLSEKAPLPPGTERLIPKLTCAVWFSADVETDSMISEFATDPLMLDMTYNQSRKAQASYSRAGGFVIDNNT